VSTVEWTASASMPELRVKTAAINLQAAIARLAAMAASSTFREARDAIYVGRLDRAKGWLALFPEFIRRDDQVPFAPRLFRLLLEHDGEFCFASIGGIVEGFAGAVTLRGMEVEAVFNPVRQPCDAGFAVHVSSDFEIQFVGIHESVGDVDADFGVIDGDTSGVRDGEIRGAGAYAPVDDGDGVRVDFGVGLGGQHGQSENHRGECGQDEKHWGSGWWFSVHGHLY
jgi:hypothetical protein